MERQRKVRSEHIQDSSDQEKYENSVLQRNDLCVLDSQVPTCSKYTTGWNFYSSLDLLPDTLSEYGPHQISDSKEELGKAILLKEPSTNIMDSQKKYLYPDYHVRKDYDQHNKVFPESQESPDTSRNIINTSISYKITAHESG